MECSAGASQGPAGSRFGSGSGQRLEPRGLLLPLVAIIVIIALIVRFIFAINLIMIVTIVVISIIIMCNGTRCASTRIAAGNRTRNASLLPGCCPSQQPCSVCSSSRIRALRGEAAEFVTEPEDGVGGLARGGGVGARSFLASHRVS